MLVRWCHGWVCLLLAGCASAVAADGVPPSAVSPEVLEPTLRYGAIGALGWRALGLVEAFRALGERFLAELQAWRVTLEQTLGDGELTIKLDASDLVELARPRSRRRDDLDRGEPREGA